MILPTTYTEAQRKEAFVRATLNLALPYRARLCKIEQDANVAICKSGWLGAVKEAAHQGEWDTAFELCLMFGKQLANLMGEFAVITHVTVSEIDMQRKIDLLLSDILPKVAAAIIDPVGPYQ